MVAQWEMLQQYTHTEGQCLFNIPNACSLISLWYSVELVVAYMGALKAGATVNVVDPQYPPERQTVLLVVVKPNLDSSYAYTKLGRCHFSRFRAKLVMLTF